MQVSSYLSVSWLIQPTYLHNEWGESSLSYKIPVCLIFSRTTKVLPKYVEFLKKADFEYSGYVTLPSTLVAVPVWRPPAIKVVYNAFKHIPGTVGNSVQAPAAAPHSFVCGGTRGLLTRARCRAPRGSNAYCGTAVRSPPTSVVFNSVREGAAVAYARYTDTKTLPTRPSAHAARAS